MTHLLGNYDGKVVSEYLPKNSVFARKIGKNGYLEKVEIVKNFVVPSIYSLPVAIINGKVYKAYL
jgi:hypothetical protein